MIDDEVKGVLIAALLLMALLASAQYYYSRTTGEPFSELGILGPDQKIGGYPTTVLSGENVSLYLYVGNQEGHVMYYNVLVKLGDNSSVVNSTTYLHAAPVATYGVVLTNNQTLLEPITLNLTTPGTNVRVVFELWDYNTTTDSFTYTGLWNQLFVNVTSP